MSTGEKWRQWYLANREVYNAYQRAYWRARRDYVRPTPEESAEKRRKRLQRWREAQPDAVQAGQAAANANKRAKRLGLEGRLSTADVLALWTRQPVCLSCGTGRGVDHVVRFADGGVNAVSNVQNLCRPCNARKENAGRALAPEDPNYERARKVRERRHRNTTGENDLVQFGCSSGLASASSSVQI